MTKLHALVDDSDPDTPLSQTEHQAADCRNDPTRRTSALDDSAGFRHDLGKALCFDGEPQWRWRAIRFGSGRSFRRPTAFTSRDGLRNVHLSWGHDEYMYRVTRDST